MSVVMILATADVLTAALTKKTTEAPAKFVRFTGW